VLRSEHTLIGNLRVHWRTGGAGDPLVLVHGIGVSGRYLLPTAACLVDGFHVFVPDLPGWGRSDKPARPLGVHGSARALAGWLDEVGIERASFLGNSMGCQILIDLAAWSPERVHALVLVGPTVDGEARSFARQAFRLLRDALHEPLSLIPIVVSEYLRFGVRRFVATAQSVIADRPEDKAPLVRAPALVVRGERDTLVSQRFAEQLATRLPLGELAVVPGGPHALTYAEPRALARLTSSFLSERSAAPSAWPPASTGS
jgi:pimeloyl-ACP methyl ester carboxylesterase